MVTVAVLVPFRGGDPHRDRSWAWARTRWEQQGWEVVVGSTPADGFSRTQGILDARAQCDADVFVVADADVWCDRVDELAVHALVKGWAVPGLLHRLSDDSSSRVLAGDDWRGLPLSTDNHQDAKPYRVHAGGTLLVLTAEAFDVAPPDPRFVGWGQEDQAWAHALRCVAGEPWRSDADVVHLWHPPEPRKTRVTGNEPNVALLRRYQAAQNRPAVMRALIEEGRAWASSSSSSIRAGSPRS